MSTATTPSKKRGRRQVRIDDLVYVEMREEDRDRFSNIALESGLSRWRVISLAVSLLEQKTLTEGLKVS